MEPLAGEELETIARSGASFPPLTTAGDIPAGERAAAALPANIVRLMRRLFGTDPDDQHSVVSMSRLGYLSSIGPRMHAAIISAAKVGSRFSDSLREERECRNDAASQSRFDRDARDQGVAFASLLRCVESLITTAGSLQPVGRSRMQRERQAASAKTALSLFLQLWGVPVNESVNESSIAVCRHTV